MGCGLGEARRLGEGPWDRSHGRPRLARGAFNTQPQEDAPGRSGHFTLTLPRKATPAVVVQVRRAHVAARIWEYITGNFAHGERGVVGEVMIAVLVCHGSLAGNMYVYSDQQLALVVIFSLNGTMIDRLVSSWLPFLSGSLSILA